MSTLWISEYNALAAGGGSSDGHFVPAGKEPSTDQTVTFSTATQSAAFVITSRFVRVQSDADCHLAFGENPTATTSSKPLGAGITEFFGIEPGHKISVVEA